MARKPSSHQTKTHWPSCCLNASSAFRRLSGCYFIMQELLITSCWLHSMPSAHAKLRQWYTLNKTLLNYVATYPNDGILYKASNMVLCTHADAGYLNETRSHSRAGAHIYFLETPYFKGAVLTITTIIKFAMALAANAELAALFIAAHKMVPHQQILIDMGWPQPHSPIQKDNSTAVGVTNKTIVPKRSKMMHMRLWWIPQN
jgi:hypothetical protein